MWLPDTNVWIALLNPPPTPVKARFQALDPAQIFLCDVVKKGALFRCLAECAAGAKSRIARKLVRYLCITAV